MSTIGNLLSEFAEKYAKREEEQKQKKQNFHDFQEKVRKLAKKHKIMFNFTGQDGDLVMNFSNIDDDDYAELGFETRREFGMYASEIAKKMANSAVCISVVAGIAIESDRGAQEVELPEEPCHCRHCEKPIYDDDGKDIGSYTPNLHL